MTGIQEILRVFFFSLLLLHDLTLAFSCTVLCSSSLLLGNLSPFPFQHLNLTGCAKKMKLTKLSINSFSTCWLQRACYLLLNIPYLLIFFLHVLNGVIGIIFKWGPDKFKFCFLKFSQVSDCSEKNSNQFHVISKVHHTEMHRLE